MTTLRALVPVLAIAALAFTGCGGDDDSVTETPVQGTGGAEQVSKEEFISEADGVCAEVNAAVGTLDSSATDAASAVAQKADLYEGMIERIRDIGEPDDDAGLADFFTAGEELVQAEQDARLAAEQGDDAGLAAAESDASSALASFQSAAEAYGFEECGQGPSAPSAIPQAPVTTTPGAPAPATPSTPVAPAPAPVPAPAPAPAPTAPTGGAATGGGTGTGGSTGGSSGGSNSGSGGIGPG
jgi:peptidoglycan DL-endopeptidase CwlO